jgi:hypothetical protein
MPFFIARVELHDALRRDYEALHAAMATEGFSRSIRSDGGTVWQLPEAEYAISGNYTVQQVLAKAERAAGKTRKKYAILVTEAKSAT